MQGQLSYDKPKGLAALLLPILCPPTDFVDMQKLTKLLIRIAASASYWVVTLSFIVVPAWLWLLRHELLQDHRGDAAAVLALGLVILGAADWICSAAACAANARSVGVFTAGTISASQLLPTGGTGRFAQGTRSPSALPALGPASKPAGGLAGASAPAPYASSLANDLPGGGSRVAASSAARSSQQTTGVNGSVGSQGPLDPLVRQVKQRIIKLEKILFGNDLTEADISPDALSSRVRLLCTEVGVPFGGPGGSSTRLSTSELDHQLKAVESALGVM
ncbi:hypothetical protein VOLCADRAFT_99462 [Volvox carteri f. nagariensis]|uniref:Uncharacterized protein n=1 Tax=Volvox carteri f. nagariensis TaxID=3068 RepID=D8UHV1_VOLCA|nr:uncharacterized protein VOLCADRAFT_99462 [Volvox carteri f. nagariensis]EFJ40683.1 hypothetical protein VOLCADRAFT_99462 [Volvox carteri f. nagariensis]|eukprot:XP_002958229.1 hypothetical protein VOLCADRAFT_99462 [Volvox carteri f. nagariensis]